MRKIKLFILIFFFIPLVSNINLFASSNAIFTISLNSIYLKQENSKLTVDTQLVCGNTTIMNAFLPTGDTGIWITPTGVTAVPIDSPTATVTGNAPSIDTLLWVVYNTGNRDTTMYILSFIEKPQVDACPGCYRLENTILSTGDFVSSVRTDTTCFTDSTSFYRLNPLINFENAQWSKFSSNINFKNPITGNENISDEKQDSLSVIIYNSNADSNYYYTLVYTVTDSLSICENKDTLLLSIAKEPSGNIEYREPYCNGEFAKIWAEADTIANPTNWNWQFFDNPIIDSTESGNSVDIDSLNQGPHYVSWLNNDCDNLIHKISLISTNDWGCSSELNIKFIKEPEVVYPKFNNILATCGNNNGIIKIINDTIITCEDTINYTILSCWHSSTLVEDLENGIPSFVAQIDSGANCDVDSLYGLSPLDTSWITIDYVSLTNNGDTNQYHCKDTIPIIIDDSGYIDAIIDDEEMVTEGAAPLNVTMYHDTPDAIEYQWRIKNEEDTIIYEIISENPAYVFPKGKFGIDLIVQSKELCYDTTTFEFIIVDDESYIKIPNVFTPNGDNANDYFQVYAKSLKLFEAFVINRWGEVLYKWNDFSTKEAGWDGKIGGNYATPGVYFYVIKYQGMYDDEITEEKGAFQLAREKQ